MREYRPRATVGQPTGNRGIPRIQPWGGRQKPKRPPEIDGGGYVVSSLASALWAFHHGDSFLGGLYLAVNLGNDSDTTGAVYGQLAGAYYGAEAIPLEWRDAVERWAAITDVADELYTHSQAL